MVLTKFEVICERALNLNKSKRLLNISKFAEYSLIGLLKNPKLDIKIQPFFDRNKCSHFI